jgi:hypothetical protein
MSNKPTVAEVMIKFLVEEKIANPHSTSKNASDEEAIAIYDNCVAFVERYYPDVTTEELRKAFRKVHKTPVSKMWAIANKYKGGTA